MTRHVDGDPPNRAREAGSRAAALLAAAMLCLLLTGAGRSAPLTANLGGKVFVRHAAALDGILGKQAVFGGDVVIETSSGSRLTASTVTVVWDPASRRVARLTAEGKVELTGPGARITAATATAYLNRAGDAVERAEADGGVVFHGEQTGGDGSATVADGTGDHLEYVMAESLMTLVSSDPTGVKARARAHIVTTTPGAPGTPPEVQDIVMEAGRLTYNLKTQVFSAKGNVRSGLDLPKAPTKAAVPRK